MNRIGAGGALAEAAGRLAAMESYEPLPRFTTWELVCEEIVDTEYSPAYYEQVLAELYRRGLTPEKVTAMRLFAWETAGWLNFEMMLWDWCSLDEADIERDRLAAEGWGDHVGAGGGDEGVCSAICFARFA